MNNEYFDENYLPTYEEVLNDLMCHNKSGNPSSIHRVVTYVLNTNRGSTTPEGGVLSFGYLINKYKEYLVYTNAINANKDEKYIKDANKIKDVEEWINNAGHKKFYEIPKDNTDNYLLSSISIETLKLKLKVFKEKYYINIPKQDEPINKPEEAKPNFRHGASTINEDDLF